MGIIQRSGRWNRSTKRCQQWEKRRLVQWPVPCSFLLENFASFPLISYIQATLNCCFVLMISVTYHCAAKRPEPPEKNQRQQEEEDQQSNSQDGPIWLEEKHRAPVSSVSLWTQLPPSTVPRLCILLPGKYTSQRPLPYSVYLADKMQFSSLLRHLNVAPTPHLLAKELQWPLVPFPETYRFCHNFLNLRIK